MSVTQVMPGTPTVQEFEVLLGRLSGACHEAYGPRLVALAVFGSVGRGNPRPDSDVDVLIVAEPLPRGRLARVAEFAVVDRALAGELARARALGVSTTLSPIFKTPEEVRLGSPLFFDMVDDARLLYDRGGFLANRLARLRARLEELGSRRVWKDGGWLWDLKPDYRPGEEFEL